MNPDRFPDTRRYRVLEEAGRPWRGRWGDDPRPLVYLTLGTVAPTVASQAGATFEAMAEAVSRLPVRGLLTVADGLPRLPDGPPANLQVEPFVPQETVMGEAAVVVCHGGSGTVLGALGAGVPLVILPMLADQLANGTMVARAGAGLVLDPPLGAAAVPWGWELLSRIRH